MTNMRRYLSLLIATAATLAAAAAPPAHTVRIEPQRNERWWGCNADGQRIQPLSGPMSAEEGRIADTTEFLLSSAGRYIWSARPFAVAIDEEGTFTVTSDYEEVNALKGGRTLREAYLYCIHKHIRPQVSASESLPFETPLFDAGTPPLSTTLTQRGTLLLPNGWQAMHTIPDSTLLTVTPYIPAAGWDYTAMRRAGDLLRGSDGRHPLIVHLPEGYFACLNIADEEVAALFAEQLDQLARSVPVGNGILLCFDCGQVLSRIHDTAQREAFSRNWRTLAERFNAVILPPLHGTPPQWRPFAVAPENLSPETLRSTVTRMLNLGLTGRIYPFMTLYETEGTHDDAALLRAVQLAAFLPISVISTDTTRFADEMHLRTLHRTLERRRQLNGYIETLLHESLVTHEPIIRLMEYQYPGQGFADCTDQFMLGSDCLVAPLFDDAVQRTVRLPRGTWIATDGTKYRGPRVIRIDVSDGHMPVFVKQ